MSQCEFPASHAKDSRPRRRLPFLSAALLVAAAEALPVEPALAECVSREPDALLILDASYSMLRLSGGISRFGHARQAVIGSIDTFPDRGQIALRVYGSEAQTIRHNCTDSVLKVPFAPAATNRSVIRLALGDIHARGLTPIAYALQQAVADFPQDSVNRTIVLISDGGESCGGDPCLVARGMATQGFVINTVAITPDALGYRQLQCIANATGGRYLPTSIAQLPEKVMEALGICPVAVGPTWRDDDISTALG